MDRFIVKADILTQTVTMCLKSNMDRFIVFIVNVWLPKTGCLKSNMDRFIDAKSKNGYWFSNV